LQDMSECADSFTEHDLSNNNRLSDLRKHKVYCGSPSASSAYAWLRPDSPAGTLH